VKREKIAFGNGTLGDVKRSRLTLCCRKKRLRRAQIFWGKKCLTALEETVILVKIRQNLVLYRSEQRWNFWANITVNQQKSVLGHQYGVPTS